MGKTEKKKKKEESTPLGRGKAQKTKLLPEMQRSFSIVSLSVAWRYTVVYLLEVASWTLKEVASLVGKKPMECAKWANRMWANGSLEDLERTGRPTVIAEADVESVKAAFTASLPGTSLKVIMKRLQDEGKISKDVKEETLRMALQHSGWSHQKVHFILPLHHETMDTRWAFAVKYRDTGLGKKAIFTDSKYFTGGDVEPRSKQKGFCAWAPDGEPRTIAKTQGASYQVHAYGGVCKYGMTDLTIVSGTTGLADAYKYARANPFYEVGSSDPAKAKHVTGWTSSVAHEEYRDIVMGGGPRKYKGLIHQAKQMFEKNGLHGEWYWQQDGAPAHSIKDTQIGKETRRLLNTVAPNVVEWPPSSPDLSPIENVWQQVEHILWRDFTWTDKKTFQQALLKAWDAVRKDGDFIRKIMASVDRRRASGGDEGGRIAQCLARKGGQTDY